MEEQLIYATGMSIYVSFVLFATKIPFDMMVSRGIEEIRAVYYNRKIVHMLAGGWARSVCQYCSKTIGIQ